MLNLRGEGRTGCKEVRSVPRTGSCRADDADGTRHVSADVTRVLELQGTGRAV